MAYENLENIIVIISIVTLFVCVGISIKAKKERMESLVIVSPIVLYILGGIVAFVVVNINGMISIEKQIVLVAIIAKAVILFSLLTYIISATKPIITGIIALITFALMIVSIEVATAL